MKPTLHGIPQAGGGLLAGTPSKPAQRAVFQAVSASLAHGEFDILAINAGEGNGWQFSAAVLRQSLSLWQGAACFLDHRSGGTPATASRSLRDLAGVCHTPRWDETRQGVRLRLKPLGPAAELLADLGRALLVEAALPGAALDQPAPQVGFSADLLFQAEGRRVQRILRIFSLDLVYQPARGGAFLGAAPQDAAPADLQLSTQLSGGDSMDDMTTINQPVSQPLTPGEPAAALSAAAAVPPTDSFHLRQASAYLLEARLSAARLPLPAAEFVRSQFAGRIYQPAELEQAIQAARRLVSDLTGSAVVQGPGRIQAMFNTEDQLQAAVDDLLGARRTARAEQLKTQRLAGIKELYMLLTGDRDLYGGYYAERVSLATTANFSGLVKNAMNKIVAEQWEQLGAIGYNWWQRVTTQEHFETLHDITGVLVGTVGSLPTVTEGGDYTELKIGDSPETASFVKYGGYIPLTLELIDRDDTRKLRLYPRELAKAGLRNISTLVGQVFTANSGVGPTLADGGALFNTTAVSSAGGHANLRTGALSAAEWEAVRSAVYQQPLLVANESGYYGSGARHAINPRYLLVPRPLELTARKLLYGVYDSAAAVIGENLQRGSDGDVVVVPEWTDTNNWAAVIDPRIMPGIVVGERFGLQPEVFIAGDELSPAVFMNDEHRLKVRHFVAILVQDFRALHKNNVP